MFPDVPGAVRDDAAGLRRRPALARAVVSDQPQALGPGVAHRAGEQVPGPAVMHQDGKPGFRSRVLDRYLPAARGDQPWR